MQKNEVVLMFSDIRGYSRLLELDEQEALEILSKHNEISQQLISEYNGNLIKRLDDSILATFPSVNDAYLCATDFQARIKEFNLNRKKPKRLLVSIGLHKGEAEFRFNTLAGEQVNITARLQSMAEPGAICMSGCFYSAISRMIEPKVIEYRDVSIENLEGSHNVYKTLSIYPTEFKAERPVIHQRSDFRYRIKDIEHIKGTGSSFLGTTLVALTGLSTFIFLIAGLQSQQSHDSAMVLIGAWFTAPATYFALIPASLFFAALYARRKMRAVFEDIRDVDRILAYIMAQLGYRQPIYQKGFLLFRPEPGNYFILGMRKFRARVDGNTIILQGPYLYMSRLIKMLKNYEQTGKTEIS